MNLDQEKRVHKAYTELFEIIDKKKDDNVKFKVKGSSDKAYTMVIDDNIKCNCQDSKYHTDNLLCKHICYVLFKIYNLDSNKFFTQKLNTKQLFDNFDKLSNSSSRKRKRDDKKEKCIYCREKIDNMVYYQCSNCHKSVHIECQNSWNLVRNKHLFQCEYCTVSELSKIGQRVKRVKQNI